MEYKYPAVAGGGGGNADTAKSLIVTVRNNTGTLIPKRSPVYINGALGNRPTIALASNASEATSSKTLGFTTTDIADNVDGEVIVFGRLENVDTQLFSPGQALWLGATAGTITTTKPVAPNHMVFLGVVVIANPANGVIEVSVQNGFELQELHNVLITSPANSQTLVYDSATSLWKNSTIVNAGVDANANIAVSKLASLTANKIAVTDGSGKLATNSGAVTDNEVVAYNAGTLYTVAGVTNTKVGYLSNVTSDIQAQINSKLASTLKGAPNGLAELDGSGKVPSSQLPSYVDDVLEYANLAAFPVTGIDGVIYIALDTNLCYRWGGSTYVEISPSLALGETATTAYRGDRGKIAYDHSQYMGNPHFTDISQISGVSSYALGLLNDTTAAEARTTLGLGTIATQNANSVTISGGSVNTTVSNRLRASLASLPISGGGLAATTGFVRLTAGETVLDTISDPSGILASSGVNLVLHNYTVGADVTITNAGNILTGTGDNIVLKQNASIAFVHNGNSKWSVVNYVTAGLTPSPLATTLSPAVKNTHYLTNTSGGAFSVTLPAGAAGSVIRFSDANETWDLNQLTIIPATGEKLDNLATDESLICDVKRGWVELSWNTALSSWSLQSLSTTDIVAASESQLGVLNGPIARSLVLGSGDDLVINGNMVLWSDRTSIASLAHRDVLADRFLFGTQAGTSVFKLDQDTDVPDASVNYSIKLGVTTAQASVSAGDERHIRYAFEGIEINPYKNSYLTLVFYVKSNLVGTYSIAATNLARDRTYVTTYTINVANVWEEKTVQIPLLTGTGSGTWGFTAGTFGLGIRWAMLVGSTYSGTVGQWNNGNFVGTSAQVNMASSTANTFKLAKVRVYPGTSPQLFYNPKSIAETSALASRYYKTIKVTTGGVNIASGYGTAVLTGVNFDYMLGDNMFSAPTVIFRGTIGTDYDLHDYATGANLAATGYTNYSRSPSCAKFSFEKSGIIAGKTYGARLLTTSGYMIIDAELP